jgi:hypothetical protein
MKRLKSRGAARICAAKIGLLVTAALMAALAVSSTAQAQFEVGGLGGLQAVKDGTPAQQTAYNVLSETNSRFARITIPWISIAPATPPAGFDASNPASPGYKWTILDREVRAAAANHQQVIIATFHAPTWAIGPNFPSGTPGSGDIIPGAWSPNITMLKQFYQALATRYSGSFNSPSSGPGPLPRVRYWEIWNEPDISGYLAAQNQASYYRNMLNSSYAALKSIHRDNMVIFGGMSGVGGYDRWSISPLKFAAEVLCLRRVGPSFVRHGPCPVKAHLDALAEHPYAFASSPTKHAYQYDDLLLADMSKLRTLLDTAKRLHTIRGSNQQLWATEFVWPTNPPNTVLGDSPAKAARFVAYGMYELWSAGVSTVIYAALRDSASATDPTLSGTGLLTADGTPKLTLRAFAFPFIASVSRKGGYAWGRVPVSHSVKVFVQHQRGGRWRTVKSVRTGRDGVFTAKFPARGNGTYRAQVAHGQLSLPYFSAKIPGKRLHLASPLLG